MQGTLHTARRLAKEHFWGLVLIGALLVGSNVAVRVWKAQHPGAMSVLESQAMDMTAMKPPVGAVPVATEVVQVGPFTKKVSYTGSVAPLQEQTIYPRVEGWLKNFNLYNGDRVSAGQLIALVDSPDLQKKIAEAAAGQSAAASEVSTAQSNVARMQAERAAAQGEIESAKSDLVRAKAGVVAAQRAVTQREKDIKSAQANLKFAQAEVGRAEKLYKFGAIALQEYQSKQTQAVSAEAELENKQASVAEAQANVAAAQAEVANRQSQITVTRQRATAAGAAVSASVQEVHQKAALVRQAGAMVGTAVTIDSYRYIKAPFAGVLTKRYVSPGQFVTPSTAVANVVQMDQVRLQANVSDIELNGIKVGAPVVARFTKDPNLKIDAKVTAISPLADQLSRTAVVEALVSNPGHKLLPGDAVTLDIAASGEADSITVPAGAVVQKDGMSAVWVGRTEGAKGKQVYYCTMHPEVTSDKPGDCPKCLMKLVPKTSDGNKKAHLVMVSIGESDGDRIRILSGLSAGDEVIYQGHTYLREGDTVFATDWSADGPKQLPNAPGMGEMPGMDHGSNKATDAPSAKSDAKMDNMSGMNHSQMKSAPAQTKATPGQKTYVCPMHPHEMSHNPNDRCKECGMALVEKK